MRLKPEGLSHGLKTVHRTVFTAAYAAAALSSPAWSIKKWETPAVFPIFWYARRDSNPQPSEPESDALSIEPLARFSLDIIAVFSRFVKRETEKIFPAGKLEKVNFM